MASGNIGDLWGRDGKNDGAELPVAFALDWTVLGAKRPAARQTFDRRDAKAIQNTYGSCHELGRCAHARRADKSLVKPLFGIALRLPLIDDLTKTGTSDGKVLSAVVEADVSHAARGHPATQPATLFEDGDGKAAVLETPRGGQSRYAGSDDGDVPWHLVDLFSAKNDATSVQRDPISAVHSK